MIYTWQNTSKFVLELVFNREGKPRLLVYKIRTVKCQKLNSGQQEVGKLLMFYFNFASFNKS